MIKSLTSGLTVYQSKQKISNLFSAAWFDEEIFCSLFRLGEIDKTAGHQVEFLCQLIGHIDKKLTSEENLFA